MGFSRGARGADSVLMSGEGEHYDRGFDNGFYQRFSAERPDESMLLLTERVWGQSEDRAAVEASRAAVRRMTGRTVRAEDVAEPETPEQRFDRLTASLATVILRKIGDSSPGMSGFAPFLRASISPLTQRRLEPHHIAHITDDLDVSTYGYDLKWIREIGLSSGGYPVDRSQYDNMAQRVKWLKRLEEAVSATVLPELRRRYRYIIEELSDFSLEVRFTDSGDCTLGVSPKEGRVG